MSVRLILPVLLIFSSLAVTSAPVERAQRVIFLIGDGMGLSHLSGAEIAKGAPLAIERCRVIGLTKTSSADSLITDSAAAGTALATGTKVRNLHLGLDPSGKPLRSLMELGQERGMATGLVVTSEVTHATPAAFYAHRENRKMHAGIASDLLASKLDVVIGGGRRQFTFPHDQPHPKGMARLGRFWVIEDLNLARQLPAGPMIAVLDKEWLAPAEERGDLSLRAMKEALRRLEKNPRGFLLMVEGSQIDYYSHKRKTAPMLDEMLDFDRLVAHAINYADAHPGTLVVIGADHETGGFAITGRKDEGAKTRTRWASKRHTATMVPLFAYGTGAERFAGVYENTEVFHKITQALGWPQTQEPDGVGKPHQLP